MTDLLLDHMAFRVIDRDKALSFFEILGYEKERSFQIPLEDGSIADSYALVHPTNVDLFVSSGSENSYMWRWVQARGGVGAIHHLAFAVQDVGKTMEEWAARGIRFLSPEPLVCDCEKAIIQVFTEPDPATGIIYELINRNGHPGFCPVNVQRLMDSAPD